MNGVGNRRVDESDGSDLLADFIEGTSTPWADLLGEEISVACTSAASGAVGTRFQSWRQFPGRPQGQYAIAEVRWKPIRQNLDLRFGIDVCAGGRAEREAAWGLATALNGAIRADRFAAHLRELETEHAELLLSPSGSGRPSVKGNWAEIVAKGFERGDASRYNPGYHREGDTRFEASVRVDATRATGPDIVALLGHALDYLAESVAASKLRVGCCTLRQLTRIPASTL